MRASYIIKTAIMAISALMLFGCWDAKDVEERTIVTAVIVDEQDDDYRFIVEVVAITSKMQNPEAEQGQPQSPMTAIIEGSGKTFADARMDLEHKLNKPIFLGAVQALILTEDYAKSGILEYIHRVRQDNQYRKNIDVVVIKDDPKKFLETSPVSASAVGFAVEHTLETHNNLGHTFQVSLADIMEKLEGQNKAFLASLIENRDNQPALTGYAVFGGDTLIGYIPYENARGIVYTLMDGKADFIYVVSIPDGELTIRAELSGRRFKAFYNEGNIHFELNYKIKATMLYPKTHVTVTDSVKAQAKAELERMIQEDVNEAIKLAQQEFEVDFLSLSETFRIRYPDIYKGVNWDEEFKKASFAVNVSAEIGEDKTVDYNPYTS